MKYRWPGNVRELRNTIERIILIEAGNILTREHFRILDTRKMNETEGQNSVTAENKLDYIEVTKGLIRKAMKTAGGNVSEAARLMNIPSYKLRYRIKKYGLIN
jgi:transcriptional regulator with PAS, ATPase and Fis domain